MNAEVNSGNRKAVLPSNYTTRICDAMPHCGNAVCINNQTIKLYTHSDSFRYAKQCKGGHVRSFGGFAWLPIDKKVSSFSSKNLSIFFLASCCCWMKLDTCKGFCIFHSENNNNRNVAFSIPVFKKRCEVRTCSSSFQNPFFLWPSDLWTISFNFNLPKA